MDKFAERGLGRFFGGVGVMKLGFSSPSEGIVSCQVHVQTHVIQKPLIGTIQCVFDCLVQRVLDELPRASRYIDATHKEQQSAKT